MLKEYEVFLGLGSNQGDRLNNIKTALNELQKNTKIKIEKISQIYKSKAICLNEDNPEDFFNAICLCKTSLNPEGFLRICQEIENKLGRKRQKGSINSRTIDLDILFFDNLILKTENLSIPHPEAFKRDFTIIPLKDIIEKDWKDPVNGWTYSQIYKNIKVFSNIEPIAK